LNGLIEAHPAHAVLDRTHAEHAGRAAPHAAIALPTRGRRSARSTDATSSPSACSTSRHATADSALRASTSAAIRSPTRCPVTSGCVRSRPPRSLAAAVQPGRTAPCEKLIYLVVDPEATATTLSDTGHERSSHRGRARRGQAPAPDRRADPVRGPTHPGLTPFCTRLTNRLAAFGEGALFCSWGAYDRNQLAADARRHGIAPPLGPDHWNLKEGYALATGTRRGLGTLSALRRLGLEPEGTHHRGIDDARNIARMLPYLLGRGPNRQVEAEAGEHADEPPASGAIVEVAIQALRGVTHKDRTPAATLGWPGGAAGHGWVGPAQQPRRLPSRT
jgi:hypothetical protein